MEDSRDIGSSQIGGDLFELGLGPRSDTSSYFCHEVNGEFIIRWQWFQDFYGVFLLHPARENTNTAKMFMILTFNTFFNCSIVFV